MYARAVVGHYHDFFSLLQLRYMLGTCNGMAYMALWMDLLLVLLLLLRVYNIYISQSNLTTYTTSYTHNIPIFYKSFP